MYNYKMTIAYDGTKYNGWQKQTGAPLKTIQGKLEHILSLCCNQEIQLIASGRTDAGVHAKGQVANFHTNEYFEPQSILDYVAQYLAQDVAILDIKVASERFHARYNAKFKTYEYKIDTGLFANPFTKDYCYHLHKNLDLEAMKQASAHLIGTHDFASFTSMKSKKKSTVRMIADIKIEQQNNIVTLSYRGDGFMQHMVRILSGTLIEVGIGERTPQNILEVLEAKERAKSGPTAPANGLCLVDVEY
ncbi:MAG: tRNA pseudouridine(38-40) synthase TruA [Epulopiscium sp. Nele67-Bin005]|nr:MAG: tRNA pseudouridine(38-40) synthase TruA [Epulopiscium sp. Nele67-Bin005]